VRYSFFKAFLADSDEDSLAWRLGAINRLVEVDLPQFGINVPAPAMLRFWRMLARFHGQTWNAADPARSMGVSEPTVRRYLDHLTQTFMVRQLQPWFENLAKRGREAFDRGAAPCRLAGGRRADCRVRPTADRMLPSRRRA
jgi:hypothetical protein